MNGQKPGLDILLEGAASRMASRLAVRESGKDWDYGELLARSEDFSRRLASLGIERGHRIALMLPNSGVFVAAFFGVLRAGAVVVPFSTHFRRQELESYLGSLAPSAIVVAQDSAPLAGEVLGRMGSPPVLIGIDGDGITSTLRGGEKRDVEKIDSVDVPVLLQFTSGSTGEPKRVLRTHGQLLFELKRLAEVFSLGDGDRFLGAAPFSHVNGLVRTMLTSMVASGTLYPVQDFNRRKTLRILSEEGITYFGGVPYMYISLAATPLRGTADLSNLRVAFSSSAPLLPEDNLAFREKYGFFIRQVYGSTETGTISVNLDRNIEESLGTVGLPLEGVRVEILDQEGQVLPQGQEGEIAIASPAGITAYENNPEADAWSFREGFYLSGDLGFRDSRGRLTLTGRKKFLINRGGYEVNPFETERAIRSHPRVQEVVVFGLPTRHGDQSIKALIVADGPCTERGIIDHCRGLIADFKIPGIIEFVTAIPKTPTGKILRDKIG